MLPGFYEDNTFDILGMDPGSNKFGFSLLEVNINNLELISSIAWTIDANDLAKNFQTVLETHGDRVARIYGLQNYLYKILNIYNPHYVASEAPFINNRFPAAGIALTEVLSAIRQALIEYDPEKELFLIPPSNVKNAVKAKGGDDKNIIKQKVCALDLKYIGDVSIDKLDEHSIDALAVGYAKLLDLRSQEGL